MKWKIEELAEGYYAVMIDSPYVPPNESLIISGISDIVAENIVFHHNYALERLEDKLMLENKRLEDTVEEMQNEMAEMWEEADPNNLKIAK